MCGKSQRFSLNPAKRVLYLTKDPELIKRQLDRELVLHMRDLEVGDLLDNISTDDMTPAWVCFDHLPQNIAVHAYAGLMHEGRRIFPDRALLDGGFEVIVSGCHKGVGSSRETAVQAEKWCGIRLAIAESFAPIHARNNINQGVLMGDHALLLRLEEGQAVPLSDFTRGMDEVTSLIVACGGLFKFYAALQKGEVSCPAVNTPKRPLTMAEKVIVQHLTGTGGEALAVKPHDAVMVKVDGGYSHEFTSAQVHTFLQEEIGADYRIASDPAKFAVFEDHLVFADDVARMAPLKEKIQTLRDLQGEFQRHTGVRDYSAQNGSSPGICHQVAREDFIDPGDFVQATDSHTCMGGGNNALAFGVGATEYAALLHHGFTFIRVPESIRFELTGRLRPGVTAKDLMLWILKHHARPGHTLDRVMEFGGPGLFSLSMDERATLANMATECSAKAGICEADRETARWILAHRDGAREEDLLSRAVAPDPRAEYGGGVHSLDLSKIEPMVADPGNPEAGIPSDPTNGATVASLGEISIDIAYGGSCTAGKEADMEMYAQVFEEARQAGRRVAPGVRCFIQFGSRKVESLARAKGYEKLFRQLGVEVIGPGCGACIGCGPGVSTKPEQVTISAINRNYRGRSGPGRMYLASPLTVAASAICGRIASYRKGMFLSSRAPVA